MGRLDVLYPWMRRREVSIQMYLAEVPLYVGLNHICVNHSTFVLQPCVSVPLRVLDGHCSYQLERERLRQRSHSLECGRIPNRIRKDNLFASFLYQCND